MHWALQSHLAPLHRRCRTKGALRKHHLLEVEAVRAKQANESLDIWFVRPGRIEQIEYLLVREPMDLKTTFSSARVTVGESLCSAVRTVPSPLS